jgi:CheY-like chemotaxis protein
MNTSIDFGQKAPGQPSRKSAYLHKARHDIHGAMHVVTGMSQVLALSDTLSPSQQKAVALLKKNADLAMGLVDDMFDFVENEEQSRDKESDDGQIPMFDDNFTETPLQKPHVLLVEDSESNILIASSFLEELGYDYDTAESGAEAVKKFSAGHYDAIIMDVQMPGMDGLEATRQIRTLEKKKKLKPTPILATTGNATADDMFFCTKAGMNDCLTKPFELDELNKKLRKVTQRNDA